MVGDSTAEEAATEEFVEDLVAKESSEIIVEGSEIANYAVDTEEHGRLVWYKAYWRV